MTTISKAIHTTAAALIIGSGAAHSLTSGPSMPEYTQFEQVEAMDMVNLATGSFTWSLPVMTVPGPALGFPVVLAYHASPGQKDEASWVGLGWNLQAGAITRQVNKIPDDFKNDPIHETIKSSKIHGWSASIGYNGTTVGIAYHSEEGWGGYLSYDLLGESPSPLSIDMTVGIGSAKGRTGSNIGLSQTFSVLKGQSFGVGANAYLSVGASQGGGVTASYGASLSGSMSAQGHGISTSLASVGANLSQAGGLSGGGAVMGIGVGPSILGKQRLSEASFRLTIFFYGKWTLGFNSWKSWIEGNENDKHFGFYYADAKGMNCAQGDPDYGNCMNGMADTKRKHEFLAAEREYRNGHETKLMRTSEDTYIVLAQGISGVFKPFRKEDGDYSNALEYTEKCKWFIICYDHDEVYRTAELDENRNLLNSLKSTSDVYWRYVDDVGGAEFTAPSSTSRDQTAFVSVQSKIVKPKFDGSGKIVGFDVTNTSGVRYSFDFPLKSVWEARRGYENGNITQTTTQDFLTSYAYAWLLTSIKSVDYIDLGNDGISKNDLGGWVKFTYGDGVATENFKPVQYWATPYHDPISAAYLALPEADKKLAFSGPNAQTNITTLHDENVPISNSRSAAFGMKEIAYLHNIETPTHKAIFKTEPRLDNHPFKVAHAFDVTENENSWDADISLGPVVTVNSGSSKRMLNASITINPNERLADGIDALKMNLDNPVVVTIQYTHANVINGVCVDGVIGEFTTPELLVGQTWNASGLWVFYSKFEGCSSGIQISTVSVKSPIGTGNASRRLKSIELFELAVDGNSGSGEPISKVEFNQDYNLCPSTPNSFAPDHGKLTLNEIVISADGSNETKLPPYRFSYGTNVTFQGGAWVPWEKGQWDRWGNRCLNCNDGYHEPDAPGDLISGAAWNLSKILSPSGAEISITYAPRHYNYVGAKPIAQDQGDGINEILLASGGPEMFMENHIVWETLISERREPWWHYRVPLANIRSKLAARGLTIENYRFQMESNEEWEDVSFASTPGNCAPWESQETGNETYDNAWLHYSEDGCGTNDDLIECGGTAPLNHFKGARVNISASSIESNPLAFVAGFHQIDGVTHPSRFGGDFELYASVTGGGATEEWANGSVVSEVKIREPFSNTIQSMQYSYSDGVTPSLPATYSDYGDSREKSGRGIELYQGDPNVIYSTVTATINHKNKTEYHFLTAKDLPVQFGSVPNASGLNFASAKIMDMSALWGAMWKKVDFKDDGTPIKTTTNSWGGNFDYVSANVNWDDRLPAPGLLKEYPKKDGVNYVRTFPNDEGYKPYFGLHQTIASHRYFNSSGCFAGNGCPQSNILTSQAVWSRVLPVVLKTEVTQEGLQTVSHSYYHDFRSGTALKARQENSDGSINVTEVIPAYYQYPGMSSANSITQNFATTSYHYPKDVRTDFMQDEAASRAISSNLTIWRPYDTKADRFSLILNEDVKAYRQYQSYVWRDNPGESSASHWIPDDRCQPYIHDIAKAHCPEVMATAGTRWHLTEQVNRYDAFSHATDVMDARGINQTTLFGPDSSLPVAFLLNTPIPPGNTSRTLQAFYESFEGNGEFKQRLTSSTGPERYSTQSNLAKSGKIALEVKNATGSGSMACFDLGVLAPNREYIASAWYYDATPGSVSDGANGTRPGIFIGKNDGCSSEYFPNGYDGTDVNFAGGTGDPASGTMSWKRISTKIAAGQCPNATNLDPAILCLYATKSGSGKNVRYDEVRVKPGGSRMSTFAYEKGRMSSSVDTREVTTFYEYDGLGNLSRIRNDDGVIVSEQAKRIGQR